MAVTPNDRSILQLTLGFTPLSCPLGVPYAAAHHWGGGVSYYSEEAHCLPGFPLCSRTARQDFETVPGSSSIVAQQRNWWLTLVQLGWSQRLGTYPFAPPRTSLHGRFWSTVQQRKGALPDRQQRVEGAAGRWLLILLVSQSLCPESTLLCRV